MAIDGLQVVSIGVSDHERALDFYVNKLGFEKRMDEAWGDGNRFLTVGVPGDDTMIPFNTGNLRVGEMTGIVLGSPDPEQTGEELAARGVEFVEPPSEREWGGVMGLLKDQDGNVLALHSGVA
jgi:catechol 2,3-dioxygenase-like lactoylglutathione lyase family enzyme